MFEHDPQVGFVVLCDVHGIVLDIMLDDTGISSLVKPGQPLALIFDPVSVEKALEFLHAVKHNRAAFDWELNVTLPQTITTMFFAGGLHENNLLIVGSLSRNGVMLSFYDEIMRINHEQINQLRTLLKADAMQAGGTADRDSALYAEFMQLNNRLINTQRELARQNARLQAEHERQRIISELVSDYAFAFLVDDTGSLSLEWITEAYSRITGYNIDILTAQPDGWRQYLYPGAEATLEQHFENCLSGQADRRGLQITTRTGEHRFLRVNCQPVRDTTTGRITRLYGAAQDITQRVLAERQTRALELERERSQILTDFIEGALHEFRTPLSTMKANLYVLNSTTATPKQANAVARLSDQTEAIQELVELLATMARLDSGTTINSQLPVMPVRLINGVCDALEPETQAAQLTLIRSLPPDLPALHANEKELGQALREVVYNAIRHTPPGGTIRVEAIQRADALIISVQDSGMGIAPEDLPHIFERFWRKDKARTQRGFGLGLPIARKIMENHHGQITVESTPGTGSTFTLILPIPPTPDPPG